MPSQKLIAVKEFCVHHKISSDIVKQLQKLELIELVVVEKRTFIPSDKLPVLEKMIRLYAELDINLEGIQTIIWLLSRLDQKEKEIVALRNRLSFYEENF